MFLPPYFSLKILTDSKMSKKIMFKASQYALPHAKLKHEIYSVADQLFIYFKKRTHIYCTLKNPQCQEQQTLNQAHYNTSNIFLLAYSHFNRQDHQSGVFNRSL